MNRLRLEEFERYLKRHGWTKKDRETPDEVLRMHQRGMSWDLVLRESPGKEELKVSTRGVEAVALFLTMYPDKEETGD